MSVDLDIKDVTVKFGGIIAVNGASVFAQAGHITGLIGPNGAGKSTLFDACTGRNRPSAGTVRLGKEKLDGHGSADRAHRGLGRTFQRMELFESMTVRENVSTGPSAMFSANRVIIGQLFATRKERKDVEARTNDAMARCDISHLAKSTVADLSTGQRRLVELARVIATPFKFLLLDEPSSGLDVSETEAFGRVLTDYVRDTGCGILLVEHDMALVSNICEEIHVLDFGKIIYQGSTEDALASSLVKSAYLGEVEADA